MVAVKIKDSITLEEAIRVLAGAVKKAEQIAQPVGVGNRDSITPRRRGAHG
jgi:hypothetical protein